MKHKLRLLILSALFLITCQLYSQSFLRDSKDFILPFDNIDAKLLSNHIAKIADSARIIGLGEASHYTKECYELKHQIIKKLIEKGYDALVLEVDFGQAVLWNDYVTNGKGNVDELVAQSGWFTYRTQEFKNILIDIRKHNLTADKPFQVFGMEMTAMNYNLDWLAEYFTKHFDSTNKFIATLKEERTIVAFQQHEEAEIKAYWNLYYAVKSMLTENEQLLVTNGGENNFEIANRIAEITRQYATYISQDEFLLKVELRDQFSTRNVLWSLNHLGEDSQIAIWAHNGHVAKKSVLFSYDILGHYLSEWFGEAYYSIGFTFNEGEFGAFSSNGFKRWNLPSITTASVTKELDSYQSPYLLFDIRENLKKEIDMDSPLRQEMPIRTDVSESFSDETNPMMRINLPESYDCLIYIDKTNFPTTIDWKR
jgi:erythromycin esterase